MKQCQQCKTELPDEAVACWKCGLSQVGGVTVGGDMAGRDQITAGVDAVGRDKISAGGDVVGGDKIEIVVTEDFFRRVIGQARPPQDLRQATQRYLQCMVDRYRYLDFRGMGVSDRVPLRLALQDLYVSLKARVEMPRGETWARDPSASSGQALMLAGRKVSEDEREQVGERLSEPMPVLDMLQQHSGLVILGDPGAGKTTFLKFMVLQLATGGGAEPRLPVLVPLSAYANALAERDVRLDDFIAGYFYGLGADPSIGDTLRQALKAGSAVVMLDGLDEVKELELRDTVVRRVVDFYVFHRRAGNKFLLTSRIVGYREVRPTAEGLTECTLVDFDDDEIKDFVGRWTGALEKAARGDTPGAAQEAERERRELLNAVQHNPGVRRLAANPLLLTILALMKRQGVTLPERRVELYQKYVETLLSSWNRARGLGRPPTRDLDVVETIKVLSPLALWMHEVNPGVGLVKQTDLVQRLEAIYGERGANDPERAARQFLADVREHAGLLLERGAGQYGFIHLTFEEYLAAVALAQRGQQDVEPVVSSLAAHLGDPAWREVSLLTVGYLGIVQQRDQAAGAVVEKLAALDGGEAVVLAGDAVADAWPGGVMAASKAKVVEALLGAMRNDGQIKPPLRARAGDVLARLGDSRPGVGLRPDGLPDIAWCDMPAGPFLMGSTDADGMARGNEKPQHKVDLQAFRIARYPVTNAQYAAFARDGGYTDRWRGCWTEAGWEWKGERAEPDKRGGVFDLPNHPAVMVRWYEAIAFCHWLTEKLRAAGEIGSAQEIMLPSEAQWEKAARGTPSQSPPLAGGIERGCIYPWGDEPDPNRANYDETGIDSTSPVGCFSGGASPCGALDMAGNVWEWCRTRWQDSYKNYRDDNTLEGEAARVLRGGSFGNSADDARCAFRGRLNPDALYRFSGFRVMVFPISHGSDI